ncbi:uncharacterized protein [Nicotiana sylvestris]|uniref:Uncharacterized protein LOC104224196 n=1 Tax=Nicotiana sylvestris TaxID=4096 RepID=A0A1U7WA37_NICSY|nr:PREDICTED: uncharacterized protein LOC104224196 [Nicotiana sylvestris]XP_009774087.1 PREDICTED: uncharacterized protein LOC104224196 [Nicotiana sylvestris]XP_009774088.1 PREDICTED: uncharacterized protein LOC104224196 [Nicotiana sylvestris]XP_009774090.1 PREDICTED: uncharacterized protein LOC104224196 [Nicotiana sylvestris]XP_009774091.1 PREDICTED: uncharacterized protein LOC104224196 [Nicotiana sylvestris]
MALLPTSSFGLSSESLEQSGKQMANTNTKALTPLSLQSSNSSQGPVAILWDIENCPVPSDVRPEDVAGNIRMALRVHPVIKGAVTMFSAFGDFNAFPRRLREGCQRTGVKLIDVPNGRKDAADKAILVDMFLFALDNPPPSSIMLISGDVDFAPALHILGQRGYTMILVIPAGVGVSSALCNAGRFVWDWPSVARGEGFVPPAKAFIPCRGGGVSDIAGILMGCCQINDSPYGQNEDEAIVYRGLSQSYYNARDFSIISHSLAEYNSTSISTPCYPTGMRTQSLPPGLNEVSAGGPSSHDQSDLTWVQPGDVNGLKGQLVKLLELSGGCLLLTRVPAEYQRIYGRPLYVSEYGAVKLVNLFKKMSDAISIGGKGQKKFVYLHNSCAVPSAPPITILKRDKGKGTQEGNAEVVTGVGSSDEFSDDERVLIEEHGSSREKSDMGATVEKSLENFKFELQEILVSYSCRIFLGCFEAIYQQRYKRLLDYESFGVAELEQLLAKVKDVVIVQEEPVSKRKFLAAVGG